MNATATTNESAASDNIVTRRLNLADPADYPEADVVIFDGDCQFCQKQVLRLSRYDNNQHRLSFISLHDPRVAERYPDLTHQQLMDEMYVVTHSGQRYAGAEAVRYLSRRLPLLWIMAPLLHIPFSMPLWKWMYKQVAVRRYRWNKPVGEPECEDACEIHLKK